MTQLSLTDDLVQLSAEITIFKQQAGLAVFEIGRRLKHVKDNDLVHGQWISWLESVDIPVRTAQAMIQVYEQFGKAQTSSHLGIGKLFEMLSLPETVNRDDFITTEHVVPSTGATKTVDEMTVKELRQVKKSLQEAEQRAKQAEAEKFHFQKLYNQEKSKPVQVVTKPVEIVPAHIKKELDEKDYQITNLRHGYQSAKEKLKEYELRSTVDFNEEQSRKQREKLQHEADYNTLELRVHITQFLEKVAITSYRQGAITAADPITKKKLFESISMLEEFTNQIKAALNGRILGGIVNE